LLNKGYVVHGIKRRASLFNTGRIDHLYKSQRVSVIYFERPAKQITLPPLVSIARTE